MQHMQQVLKRPVYALKIACKQGANKSWDMYDEPHIWLHEEPQYVKIVWGVLLHVVSLQNLVKAILAFIKWRGG